VRGGRTSDGIARPVNPTIPTTYTETGSWLQGFARSHAKRVNPRIEVRLDMDGAREGRSYGIRLALDEQVSPPLGSPPIELDFREVVDGRPRFAWCAALGERIGTAARELVGARSPR
jgi:hypothetical protein